MAGVCGVRDVRACVACVRALAVGFLRINVFLQRRRRQRDRWWDQIIGMCIQQVHHAARFIAKHRLVSVGDALDQIVAHILDMPAQP